MGPRSGDLFWLVAPLSLFLLAAKQEPELDLPALWYMGTGLDSVQGEQAEPEVTIDGNEHIRVRQSTGGADPRLWYSGRRRVAAPAGVRSYDYMIRRLNDTVIGNHVEFRYFQDNNGAPANEWTIVPRVIDPTTNANARITWGIGYSNQGLPVDQWAAGTRIDHLDVWRVQIPALATSPGAAPLEIHPAGVRIWADIFVAQITHAMRDAIWPLWHQVMRDGFRVRVTNAANPAVFQERYIAPANAGGTRLPRWDQMNPYAGQFVVRESPTEAAPNPMVTGGIMYDMVTQPAYLPGVNLGLANAATAAGAAVLAAGWRIQSTSLFKTYVRVAVTSNNATFHHAFRINWGNDTFQTVGADQMASRYFYGTINAPEPLRLGNTPPAGEITDYTNAGTTGPALTIRAGLERLATE